ncbi:MAG: DNA gyrase inhibitor YacG [Betaproteobacteria bacterium]|nr:MAG: DNA gyrase inhibitor YacG [Betaproteobacteria bacterium]
MQSVRTVLCPRCGAPAVFSTENPWRPFCSERCKLIDLGAWASESYRVPGAAAPDSQAEESEKD